MIASPNSSKIIKHNMLKTMKTKRKKFIEIKFINKICKASSNITNNPDINIKEELTNSLTWILKNLKVNIGIFRDLFKVRSRNAAHL